MSETVRVRFKRLESFGNYCNAESEVELQVECYKATDEVIEDVRAQCARQVDAEIEATKKRREAEERLERETQAAYWEDERVRQVRAGDRPEAYRVICHAPEGDLERDLVDFSLYIPAGKGDYDATNALEDARDWLDELHITPELTVECRGVIPSEIRPTYLSSQGYAELTGGAGNACWMPRALVAYYATTEMCEAFGVEPGRDCPDDEESL